MLRRLFVFIFGGCAHDWASWEPYLISMQKRRCKKCGKYSITDQS